MNNMTVSNLTVLQHSLFRIDLQEAEPVEIALNGNSQDLTSFAKRVLHELFESPRSRYFEFKSMNELVPSSLLKIIKDESVWEGETKEIAKKLHDVEIEAQKRVNQLNIKIRKGGLLTLKVKHDNETKFVIIKIDDDEFLDEKDLRLKTGLPASKTRLQKAAVVSFAADNTVNELILSDSKPKITEYWYLYFLFAEQITDSETNTKNAFNAIDSLLNREVKKVSSIDYWFLRNEVINHFRNEDAMAYDDLVEKIEKHTPESTEFAKKFSNFVTKFKELPTKAPKPFDTQFDLETSAIKARMVKSVLLDDNFELRIKGEISDLKNRISANKDGGGKFIKIYSDKGYDEFSKNEN